HADSALGFLDPSDGRDHRILVGDVEREQLASRLFEVGDRLRAARGRVHRPAPADQVPGRGVPDTGRASGQQHGLGDGIAWHGRILPCGWRSPAVYVDRSAYATG